MAVSRIPRIVLLFGVVSMCMDLSSEMIHSLLPYFLVTVLGAGTVTLGLVEGIAEATASICKVFSGVLSDRLRYRKPLVLIGYGLAAISKPLFALAATAGWVLCARFVDRIGKGIRGAPRDAIVADVTPAESRGAAYGLRQALDTTGALLGPLAAIALMYFLDNEVRSVFWIAVIPAFIAVALLAFGVKEPRHVAESLRDSNANFGEPRSRSHLPNWRELRKLQRAFWIVATLGAVVTLARFSEAFLVLRALDVGLSPGWTPLSMVVMNATYVASVYPAGWWSDRVVESHGDAEASFGETRLRGRVSLLMVGLVTLIIADIVLAWGGHVATVLIGVALWGLHMGLTQGLFAAMVADTAQAELRGSAFGSFNFISGLAALASSLIAGALWDWRGAPLTFLAGAGFAAIALVGTLWWHGRKLDDIPQKLA